MQTGFSVYRVVGGNPVSAYYTEIKYGPDKTEYLREFKLANWSTSADFKVSIVDFATGKVEGSLDGNVYATITASVFKTAKMENYQIGSEMFHSVDQNAGTAANKCEVSGFKVKVDEAFQDSAFVVGDVSFIDIDKMGNNITQTSSSDWGFSDVSETGLKMWDKIVEY